MPTTGLGFRYPSGTDYAGTGPDVPRAVSELAADLNDFLTGKYALIKITNIFVGTTTYTPAAGVDGLYVECWGGGGAGGGCTTGATNGAAGGGGGSGGYSARWTTTIKTFTVAVGVGGTGVSAADGGAGGNTTFDSPSICTGNGGNGGLVSAVAGATVIGGGAGQGGGLGTGDLQYVGASGTWGICLAAAQVASGTGGSLFGGGGKSRINSTGPGNVALSYGGGGGGASIISGGASQAGGNGYAGLIRVWEWQST